jgi:hypothetical protein
VGKEKPGEQPVVKVLAVKLAAMTTIAPKKPRKQSEAMEVACILETLNDVLDRDGLDAAREAARKMLIAGIKRPQKFGTLVAMACMLETAD